MKRIDTSSAGAAQNWPADPYPGLRPFLISEESDESLIFFGRKAQIHDLLDRLGHTHFMAVLGPSGCGKSSLVKAGLIPALSSGLIYQAGANWVAAEAEPGSEPISNLAKAVAQALRRGHRKEAADKIPDAQTLAERLHASTTALVDLAEELPHLLEDNTNLLILVDQFEELFREDLAQRDEDAQLINLLLNVFNQRPEGLYVVITMRTDYLEQCATFHGLPEALNQSQFLTPRLNAQQLADAISGPVELREYGGKVEPRLARKILGEMTSSSGYDPDLLPLMQHALFWMWRNAVGRERQEGEPVLLTLEDYQALAEEGGLQGMLSKRADDIYLHKLNPEQQKIAECMFRLMSEVDDGARRRRRVTTPEEIAASAGVDLDQARAVVDIYADEAVSFIRWKDDGATLDVTHESLIRKWRRLNDWAHEERADADEYRDMEDSAAKWAEGNRAPLTEAGLLRWEEFLNRKGDVRRWAARYGDAFDAVSAYVDLSRQQIEEDEKKRAHAEQLQRENEQAAEREQAAKRRARALMIFATVGSILAAVAVGGWIYAFDQAKTARVQTAVVERQAKVLKEEGEKLEQAKAAAEQALTKEQETSDRLEEEKTKLTAAVNENQRLGALALKVMTLRRAGLVEKEVDAGRPATALRLALDTREISTDAEKPFHLALARAATAAPRPGPAFAGRFGKLVSVGWSREIGDWMALWQNGGLHGVKNPDSVALPFKAPPGYLFFPGALSSDLSRALVIDGNRQPIVVSSGPLLDPVPLWEWGPKSVVARAQFYGDGSFLATLSRKRELVIWDTETGVQSERLAEIDRFVVSPDGLRLATVSVERGKAKGERRSRVEVWDLFPNLERRTRHEIQGGVHVLKWGDGEDVILAGLRDGQVVSVTPEGGTVLRPKEAKKPVAAIAFDKASGVMAVALGRGTFELWKIDGTPERLRRMELNMNVRGLHFSADGTGIVIQSHAALRPINVSSGAVGKEIVSDGRPVALSAQGASALTIAKGGKTWIWDPASGQRKRSIDLPSEDAVPSLSTFSPDGSLVISGFENGSLQVSDAKTGKAIWTVKGTPGVFESLAMTPDNGRLAALMRIPDEKKYKLTLLSGSDGTVLKEVSGGRYFTNHGFSQDGALLHVQTARGTIEVWRTVTGRQLTTIQAASGHISSALFIEKPGSPDQVQLAAAERNAITIWDLETAEVVARSDRYGRAPRSIAVDRNGTRLIGVFSSRLTLWDLQSATGPDPLDEIGSVEGRRFVRAVFDRHGSGFALVSGRRSSRDFSGAVSRSSVTYWDVVSRPLTRSTSGRSALSLVRKSELYNQMTAPDMPFAWPSTNVVQTLGTSSRGINLWTTARRTQARSIDEERFAVSIGSAPYWADFTPQNQLVVHHRNGPSLIAPDQSGEKGWQDAWRQPTRGTRSTRLYSPNTSAVASLSPDGSLLAVPGGRTPTAVIDVETGRSVAQLPAGRPPSQSAVFGPKGQTILTVGPDATARLWAFDKTAGSVRPIRTFVDPNTKSRHMLAGSFDLSGKYIVTSTRSGQISTWSVVDPSRPISTVDLRWVANTVGFSQSGDCVFVADRIGGLLWLKRENLKQECARTLETEVAGRASIPGFRFLDYSVGPQKELVAVSGIGARRSGTVRSYVLAIYSLKSGKPIAVWSEPSRRLTGWANWSNDGRKLVAPTLADAVRVIKRPQLGTWRELIEYAERAAKPRLSKEDIQRLELINIDLIAELAK